MAKPTTAYSPTSKQTTVLTPASKPTTGFINSSQQVGYDDARYTYDEIELYYNGRVPSPNPSRDVNTTAFSTPAKPTTVFA
jgi:hypothetical protein